jgi:hypothetical protein
MRRYFKGGPPTVINRQRDVYSLDKAGFITPCDLLVKVNPQLDYGLEVVGILSAASIAATSTRSLIIDMNTWTLAGVTKQCYIDYGIHPSLSYGQHPDDRSLSIKDLFFKGESIHTLGVISQEMSRQFIDTKKIKNGNYLPSHYWKMKSLPATNKECFTRQAVKLELVSNNSFGIQGLDIAEVRIEHIKVASALMGTFMRHTPGLNGSKRGIRSKPSSKDTLNRSNDKLDEIDVLESNKENTLNIKKRPGSIISKNGKTGDHKGDPANFGLDNSVLSEDEIERLNADAEKERRLREQKSSLTKRSVPSYIVKVYMITGTMIVVGVGCCIALFIIQNTRNNYFSKGIQSVFSLNKLNSYLANYEKFAINIDMINK